MDILVMVSALLNLLVILSLLALSVVLVAVIIWAVSWIVEEVRDWEIWRK